MCFTCQQQYMCASNPLDVDIQVFCILKFVSKKLYKLPFCEMQAVDAETNPEIWGQYIKPQYIPADGSHIDMVFIPFHCKKLKHWWACICDLKQGKNFILDSMQSINVDEDNH
ncbi:hypothetical protein KSS87_013473 [Heliosperma pusillum]|nr:hypothetical protein KSS87_013473 [Heliosperma pusillum]